MYKLLIFKNSHRFNGTECFTLTFTDLYECISVFEYYLTSCRYYYICMLDDKNLVFKYDIKGAKKDDKNI